MPAQGFKDDTVQMAEGGTVAIVSVSEQSTTASKLQTRSISASERAALNTLGPNTEQQFGNVGSMISRELTTNAIEAVIMASGLIVLYLALVFGIGGFVAGLRLGTSAIVALLHDILVLIGAFAIFGYFLGWEIDSLFITAMLTVIGFSVHDTVVIFDRVRENLRHKSRGESFESLVNRSIGQTLARSINTSLTVVMTLLALVILGGQTTRLLERRPADRHRQRNLLVHLQCRIYSGGLGKLAGKAPREYATYRPGTFSRTRHGDRQRGRRGSIPPAAAAAAPTRRPAALPRVRRARRDADFGDQGEKEETRPAVLSRSARKRRLTQNPRPWLKAAGGI